MAVKSVSIKENKWVGASTAAQLEHSFYINTYIPTQRAFLEVLLFRLPDREIIHRLSYKLSSDPRPLLCQPFPALVPNLHPDKEFTDTSKIIYKWIYQGPSFVMLEG
jgi:hypothetical protein